MGRSYKSWTRNASPYPSVVSRLRIPEENGHYFNEDICEDKYHLVIIYCGTLLFSGVNIYPNKGVRFMKYDS